MKKASWENVEASKAMEKFDICHHCKLLYPENFMVKCKYSSERLGSPLYPAPYSDPYLTQISKSIFVVTKCKPRNQADTTWEREHLSAITQKWWSSINAIGNSASSVSNKAMMEDLIRMGFVLSVRESVSVLDAADMKWSQNLKHLICS